MDKKQRELRSHRCCFTGHRPQKLKRSPAAIKADLEKSILAAIGDGFTTFITGMASGVDIWAGEIVVKLKTRNPGIKLIAAVPFVGSEDFWPETWKARYRNLLGHADLVKYICSEYREDAYQQRNQWMVDKSSKVIAVFNGKPSGTMYTIQYAKKEKIPVEYLAD